MELLLSVKEDVQQDRLKSRQVRLAMAQPAGRVIKYCAEIQHLHVHLGRQTRNAGRSCWFAIMATMKYRISGTVAPSMLVASVSVLVSGEYKAPQGGRTGSVLQKSPTTPNRSHVAHQESVLVRKISMSQIDCPILGRINYEARPALPNNAWCRHAEHWVCRSHSGPWALGYAVLECRSAVLMTFQWVSSQG